ncbi:unnamed protein product [Nesidiocoris tenuis]|uniref:Uncharacterized protein n=1 Tax=Nesidiocoris tenuis TaxID=355587 RepID=A0A6H5GWF7_9HEMI|nr:unnamed protein product [Nesidiocoris tenuis]
MSVICRTDKGWVISHYDYTKKIYTNVVSRSGDVELAYNKNLFHILTPLMRDQEARNFIKSLSEKEFVISQEIKMKKRSRSASFDHEIGIIQSALKELVEIAQNRGYFSFKPTNVHYEENNSLARSTSELYNGESFASEINFSGGNSSTSPIVVKTFGQDYVIPPLCSFVCCDIGNINAELSGKTFDFILLDPPWWNKFIRRKKAKLSGKGGETVNPFRGATEKRPYERLIFACLEGRRFKNPEPERCIVSVPSAIHSHKPPLVASPTNQARNKEKALKLPSHGSKTPSYESAASAFTKICDWYHVALNEAKGSIVIVRKSGRRFC